MERLWGLEEGKILSEYSTAVGDEGLIDCGLVESSMLMR